jgi:hypothetical protein
VSGAVVKEVSNFKKDLDVEISKFLDASISKAARGEKSASTDASEFGHWISIAFSALAMLRNSSTLPG